MYLPVFAAGERLEMPQCETVLVVCFTDNRLVRIAAFFLFVT